MWSMNWAVGERMEAVCDTMGLSGGRCVYFFCVLGMP